MKFHVLGWICLMLLTFSSAQAESSGPIGQRPSKGLTNILRFDPNSNPMFDSDSRLAALKKADIIDLDGNTPEGTSPTKANEKEENLKDIPVLGSSVRMPIRFNNIDRNAPDGFAEMVNDVQSGDYESAKGNAKKFVGYLQELMFVVREITHLSVEAMVENGEKDEEEVRGVEQLLDWQMATARQKGNLPIRPNQKNSLARIKQPDGEGKAEIYFFFTLNCRFCRDMAPDVQRLAMAFKNDSRVKISGYVLGRPPKALMSSFLDYTGLQIPVFPGEEAAKTLRLAFLPAVIVVSPTNSMSYVRTGQQSYQHMFEFVRTVQGLPIEMDSGQTKLASLTIGQIEEIKTGKRRVINTRGDTAGNESHSVTLAQF